MVFKRTIKLPCRVVALVRSGQMKNWFINMCFISVALESQY